MRQKAPGSCTTEWRCLEKYFERWFWNPKLQDNQSIEQDIRAKSKTSVLSVLLTSSQLLHPINIKIRMGPIWALPERQLDCTPGDSPLEQGCLSRLGIPYLRPRDPSLPKAERPLTHNKSLVSDWQHAELMQWSITNRCSYSDTINVVWIIPFDMDHWPSLRPRSDPAAPRLQKWD